MWHVRGALKIFLHFICWLSPFQDHPSVGQLSDKLLENHIYSIFAVEKQQYQWYEVISPTQVHTTATPAHKWK